MQTGLNYLGLVDATRTETRFYGLDGTAKWRRGAVLDVLLQSELWLRQIRSPNADPERTFGSYVLAQKALTEQLFLGVLWDYLTVLTLEDARKDPLSNDEQHFVPTLSFKASEFSTLRVAYNHGIKRTEGSETKVDGRVEVQATYIIGAHPTHDF